MSVINVLNSSTVNLIMTLITPHVIGVRGVENTLKH